MFYSHEILTSRKYGVATVWLVATLGSKSSLKRINRKQILDVDVAKACQTIVDPVAPMALRLQGNLLYGVSRVYLQQCGYVLSDAQNAHNAMLMMLRTVQNYALDPEAGKARPEQLVLQDDPSFLPDFTLPPLELLADLDLGLNFDIARSGDSQSLSPFGSQHSQSSHHTGALGGLVLPTSSPSPAGGFELQVDNETAGPSVFLGADHGLDFGEPDFMFNENGEFVEAPAVKNVAGTPAARSGAAIHSDAGASAKVRKDHEEGRMGGAELPGDHMDIDLPIFEDDLPEGDAFPTVAPYQDSDQIEVVQSTSTVSAPMRKKRNPRILPIDSRMELRNKDLADWNANYLQNMDAIIKTKKQGRAAQQAKKNADYLVWGRGLGGIAQHYAGVDGPNPFEMFIGDNLFELATGISRKKVAGTKHGRDSGIDDATQHEARNVRQKIDEPKAERGRGQDDEGFSMPGGEEVELPRKAVAALDDQQIFSSMPWNMSASKHGSSVIPRSKHSGIMDQGRPGSRAASRIVSASPLHGRGQLLGLDVPKNLESDGDFDMGGNELAPPGPSSSPIRATSPSKPYTRVNEALDAEGNNFLEFVIDAISEKRNRAHTDVNQAEATTDTDMITFEELLPPHQNHKMIACQGLMMVLSLGTKGMLGVQQPTHFGDINLKLTVMAKSSQIIEISDDGNTETESDDDVEVVGERVIENQEGIDDEVEEEGVFEEQVAAGHAEYESEHDELYDN